MEEYRPKRLKKDPGSVKGPKATEKKGVRA
jgi:hypothetical protein